MKISIRTLLFSLFVVALTGCGGGGGGGDTPIADTPLTADEIALKIHHLDLSGAQGLMITGADNTTPSNTSNKISATAAGDVNLDPNSLYKVTSDGTLVRVGIMDDTNTELSRGTITPSVVTELTADYLVMGFTIEENLSDGTCCSQISKYFLVHKKTGLAYDATDLIAQTNVPDIGNGSTPAYIDTDDKNNLYINKNGLGYFENYFKIDMSTVGTSSISAQLIQSIDRIIRGEIDASGDYMLYRGKGKDDSIVHRYLNLNTDAIANISLPVVGSSIVGIYKGLNGRVYLSVDESDGRYVYTSELDSNSNLVLNKTGLWSSYKTSSGMGVELGSKSIVSNEGHANTRKEIIGGQMVYFLGGGFYNAVTVDPEGRKLIHHDAVRDLFNGTPSYQVSSDFIFLYGQETASNLDVIMRYDPVTFDYVVFSVGSTMDINRYSVLSSDKVWFEAILLSDQSTVIGEIDINGNVTITDTIAATEPDIIVMEAITPADFISINGDYQDWDISLRIKTDAALDASAGHDLTFYSQTQNSSQYFGLVEFNNDSITNANSATIINIDNMYELRFDVSSSTFKTIGGATVDLRSTGALYAIGKAIEFSVPLSQLTGATFTSLSVSTVSKELFGDVSAVVAPLVGANYEVDITMATPLGDAEVIIFLDTTYTLRFTRNTAVINNSVGNVDTNLVVAGGSITYPATDGDNITAVIPAAAIGAPGGAITPTEQSTPQTLDVSQDVM